MSFFLDPSNIISIKPSKKNSEISRKHYFNKIISSLAYLKNVAGKIVEFKDFSLESLLYKSNDGTSLNPEIFYLHDKLLLSMRNQDLVSTKSNLDKVCSVLNNDENNDENNEVIIKSFSYSEWESFIAEESIKTLKGATGRNVLIEPVSNSQLLKEIESIKKSIFLIEEVFPEMMDEINNLLSNIRVFSGKRAMGITDVRMFGCMYIRVPREGVDPVLYYCEHLVHEVSHMYLNSAMSMDPILLNDASQTYSSPIRPDPRPMLGVFHATFVTSRIVQLFHKMAEKYREEDILLYLHQQFEELILGINEVEKFAILTDSGINLKKEIFSLLDEVKKSPYWGSYDFNLKRKHRFGGGAEFTPKTSINSGSISGF
ncbi:aKG-HExxH-type peptide beta-hydroxylase [Marinomonas primoryensis]|uniref:HEXXH motif-containing putative peptide modification protein n=1 Tax=Marinomonas primoryensis TaxID=178399 RepID=A0ABV0L514_9GAMM